MTHMTANGKRPHPMDAAFPRRPKKQCHWGSSRFLLWDRWSKNCSRDRLPESSPLPHAKPFASIWTIFWFFLLLVLKDIYHYWTYVLIFFQGTYPQMEVCQFCSQVEADLVIFATGYRPLNDTAPPSFIDAVFGTWGGVSRLSFLGGHPQNVGFPFGFHLNTTPKRAPPQKRHPSLSGLLKDTMLPQNKHGIFPQNKSKPPFTRQCSGVYIM